MGQGSKLARRVVPHCTGLALLGCLSLPATALHFRAPLPNVHAQVAPVEIYSSTADAKADIRAALQKAAQEHKRVILDFGGNWCGDCRVLNFYFHDPSNAGLLAANYILVDVNVGQYDQNLDLARKYGIPLKLGVPALAILDSSGRVLYAQRHGEFEKMHLLQSNAVTAFLEKWKPLPTAHRSSSHATHSGGR